MAGAEAGSACPPIGIFALAPRLPSRRNTIPLVTPRMRVDDHFLELKNADLHDLRDTDKTRDLYVIDSHDTGIKRNRRRLLLVRTDIVAIARLDDVMAE